MVQSITPPSHTSLATNKKAQTTGIFGLMVTATLGIILVFVALTLGADIMSGVQDTQTANTEEFNVSQNSLSTMVNVSNQGSNIGLIIGVAFLLLVLVFMFGMIAKNGMGGRI